MAKVNRSFVILGILGVQFLYPGLLARPVAGQQDAPPAEFSVIGDIPSKVNFTAKDLQMMPQITAKVTQEDGTISILEGVLLRSILEKSGAPTGKTLRGKSMASYVLAKARDDYQVVFTLAELDESFGNQKILVVYKQDGKPLFGYQGPFRIFCPNDKAGARSVRMLSSIEVVQLRK